MIIFTDPSLVGEGGVLLKVFGGGCVSHLFETLTCF